MGGLAKKCGGMFIPKRGSGVDYHSCSLGAERENRTKMYRGHRRKGCRRKRVRARAGKRRLGGELPASVIASERAKRVSEFIPELVGAGGGQPPAFEGSPGRERALRLHT